MRIVVVCMRRTCLRLLAGTLLVGVITSGNAMAQEIEVPGLASDASSGTEPGVTDKAGSKSDAPTAAALLAFDQGLTDLKRRDFKKAIENFDRVIAAAPRYPFAYAERGGAHIGLGANDLAVVDLSKALDLLGRTGTDPERARLHGNRGLAYLNQSKYDLAVAEFDVAIGLDPKLAFAYANRGMSHLQRKNVDAALRDASQAIALRPNYGFALLLRGFAHNEKKLFSNAIVDFLEALKSAPENRGAILGLRQAYLAGKDAEDAAKIKLVRLADPACEPSCPEWVAIEGKIEPGSVDTLKEVLKDTGKRKLPVFVDSGGGSVNDAMAMGRLIRARGLDVVVTRTELVPCGRDDTACKGRVGNGRALGRVHAAGAICASSCGFLLASGVHRYVGASTLVGVHQITSFQTYQKVYRQYEVQRAYRGGKIVEVDRRVVSETFGARKTVQTATGDDTYVKIRKYFTEMGIDDAIMPMLISAPPKGMHWLTAGELKATSVMTDAEDGEQLLARGGVARVAPDDSLAVASGQPVPRVSEPARSSVDGNTPDPAILTKAIQVQLARIGCGPSVEDGKWSQGVRRALERYNTLTGKTLRTSAPQPETLEALAARSGLVCPPACPPDMMESDGHCVAKMAVRDPVARDRRPETKPVEQKPADDDKRLKAASVPMQDKPDEPAKSNLDDRKGGVDSSAKAVSDTSIDRGDDDRRVKTVALPQVPKSDVKPDRSSQTRNRDGSSITAPGADRTCSNFETSCSSALSYCIGNCRDRGSGGRCFGDCNSAVIQCRSSGVWSTTNCYKTGLVR